MRSSDGKDNLCRRCEGVQKTGGKKTAQNARDQALMEARAAARSAAATQADRDAAVLLEQQVRDRETMPLSLRLRCPCCHVD